jgi:Protein of unknown function, DUF481
MTHRYALALLATAVSGFTLQAQTPPGREPDVLLLADGEKLMGQLVESNDDKVRFKSDVLGELTVAWSKVKEFHSARKFAIVTRQFEAQEKRRRKSPPADVPEGPISVAGEKIEVATAAGTRTVPVADAAHVVDGAGFERAFGRQPNIFRFWNDKAWDGAITAGAALVQATQRSRTFTESVSLVHAVPVEDWLRRQNRTELDFSGSSGVLSQPGSTRIKTSIYHVAAQHDEYFSSSGYGFGQAQFDHNFSQGLDLQQTYVGGLGWSAVKRDNGGLDLKAGLSYVEQEFAAAATTRHLVGSVFDERFMRRLGNRATFKQELSVNPSWSNSRALSVSGDAALAFPVHKRLTFTLGVIENFLYDPPPGFRKNSFQSTAGLTYVLREPDR